MSASGENTERPTARSPMDRLAFIVPLLHRGAAVEDEERVSTSSRIARAFLGGSTLMAFCTGLSFATCKLMADPTYAEMTVSSVADNSHLKVLGLRRHTKSWKEYSQEMVDYISSRSYSALASGEVKPLAPLLSASFSHFPVSEHSALGVLLPEDVQQWADVHWTIAYTQFMESFGLDEEYGDDESLILARFGQYRQNGAHVYHHNKKSIKFASPDEVDYLYTLELNRFADLSKDDLSSYGFIDATRSSRQKPPTPQNAAQMEDEHSDSLGGWPFVKDMPEEFNWKKEGCVQKVKNQLQCGSCWAFSAVESLESAVCVARKHKKGLLSSPGPVSPTDDDGKDHHIEWTIAPEMPNLSEQQLVDCAQKDGNHGCHGGMMEFAFQYTMENSAGELCEEDSYDYVGVEGQCLETKCKYERDWKVVSWNNVTRFSASALQKAILNYGTIAVSVEADNSMFMFYKGGVVHDGKVGEGEAERKCGDSLNHGVAVVGWGTDADTKEPYWLVKNSWGPTWGEEGFIRLARDSGGMFGECGILMDSSYPIIKVYGQPSH